MTRFADAPSDENEFHAELPPRVCEALKRENIYTWTEAAQVSEIVWVNTPNFGRKALHDLKAALARRGLQSPEDLAKDVTSTGRNRRLYHSTLINIALAYSALPGSELMQTDVLEGDQTRFNAPRLYISRKAAEILRTHPELRLLDIQDADAIAFDPNKRTNPDRREQIAHQLMAGGGGARCAEIIENFKKKADGSSEAVGEKRGKSERRSLLVDKNQGGN